MIRKNFTVEKAQDAALKNIADIIPMCKWNYDHNIFVLRLSSDIFPHFNDNEVETYDMSFAMEALRHAGEAALKYKQRINFHPGQYNQIGAKEDEVFSKTCMDLKMHADILDAMGVGIDGILCIHGGGVYNDKEKTIERWIKQFQQLPENVKTRICIENCERCYSVKDCLYISDKCNIPVILDSHHFECFNSLEKKEKRIIMDDVLPHVLETWTRRGMKPLFHIAEQRPDSRLGAHSDFIEKIPEYMLNIPDKYGLSVDIEVEAKMKEKAILKLYSIYPFLDKPCNKNI